MSRMAGHCICCVHMQFKVQSSCSSKAQLPKYCVVHMAGFGLWMTSLDWQWRHVHSILQSNRLFCSKVGLYTEYVQYLPFTCTIHRFWWTVFFISRPPKKPVSIWYLSFCTLCVCVSGKYKYPSDQRPPVLYDLKSLAERMVTWSLLISVACSI